MASSFLTESRTTHSALLYIPRLILLSLLMHPLQLVTLPNLHIIDYILGLPGSIHDSTAFWQYQAFQESDELFYNGEWLWANSAYRLAPWCIVPYKKPLSLLPENKQFNYHLSRVHTQWSLPVRILIICV